MKNRNPRPDELTPWGEALIKTYDGFWHVATYLGDGEWQIQGLGWCESKKVIEWVKLPD